MLWNIFPYINLTLSAGLAAPLHELFEIIIQYLSFVLHFFLLRHSNYIQILQLFLTDLEDMLAGIF